MSLHNLCFVFGLILALGTTTFAPQVNAARAFFVFGDSLVDSGNNNFLLTTARADAYPYGVDYPTRRATGRFSNGYNIPDLISQNLGASESPLPYLNPALGGARLLVGANFASAGVGILNDTGVQFVNIIRIPLQLTYFRQYQQRVSALIGPEQTEQLISNSLTLMTLGGNDFVNNYFLVQNSARSRQYSIQDYVPFIISEYRKILMELYNLGVRRVLVTGTGPLGCAPGELSGRSRNGECVAEVQQAAGLFNPQLAQMLQEINSQVGRDVFIAANTQQSHLDFVNNPAAYGFIESKVACCGQGRFNGFGFCTRISSLCARRDLYAFWDAFHPTERANRLIVQQMMTGSTDYMSPMNLSTILAMDG